jgi:hypothetical protein
MDALAQILIFRYSLLGEISDSTNQSIIYPIYGLFWPIGSIAGYDLVSKLAMILC